MTNKPASTVLALDGEQLMDDLEQLAAIGGGTGKGINRVAYTPADRAGREWVENQMRALGMVVRVDALGNTIATYPGTDPSLRPIALGSHTDTVPDGGKYDGALGVLAALACVRTLHATGTQTRHPIEVINFAAEEATLPGGTFGSRGMVGTLTDEMMQQVAWDGQTAADHLRAAGYDPAQISQVARPVNSVAAYLELHIEQGGILDKAGIPIGVVLGIVGIRRYMVTFQGYANHAGTTPMADRQDALVKAAPFITTVRDVAIRHGIVGTIGTVYVYPGAPNVIPGQVDLTVEIRSLDDAILDRAAAELAEYAEKAGATFKEASNKSQVMSDPSLMDAFAAASDELGLAHRTIASGAGHDAMCMAEIGPEAMLFVPSRGGVSHSPDEYTEPEHCINGARVLLGALLKLDASLDS
jgi:N-carbamoyl-L-amino-acid hydrolase